MMAADYRSEWMRRRDAQRDAIVAARAGGFSAAALRDLAAAPIMNPLTLFLPDGRCSLAEAERREALTVETPAC